MKYAAKRLLVDAYVIEKVEEVPGPGYPDCRLTLRDAAVVLASLTLLAGYSPVEGDYYLLFDNDSPARVWPREVFERHFRKVAADDVETDNSVSDR